MLNKNQYTVTCDVHNCRNIAEYTITQKGRLSKFYICKHCLEEVIKDYRKYNTPRSPKNALSGKSATIKERIDD